MRCYYEVLNVARDADDGEIKTAYRKMALKWHPDKNLDDLVNAKEQFQIVQQAYEVLSDKQERAWYDRHREQIIRSGNPEVNDDHLDVFQYFTTSCFKDYNDDEMGFYTVYRNLFDQIAKEDMDYYENKEEFMNIPSFGNSNSGYDEIVNPFYAHWMSYSTKKSYVWLDPYNIKDIRDRRLLKAVEKENKKSRQKAKKERNEEIRNLVMFVRKRDKRVQAWNKLNEAKIEENRKKQDVIRKQKLEERRKMNESQVQAEWTKFENVSSELTEIEKNLEKQFGNSDSSDLEEYNDLYCAACNKLFKTEKSFQNHESSKKHKENIQALKEQLLEDDEEYENIDSNDELDEEEIEIVKEVLLDSISKTTTDESSLEEEIDTTCSNINKTEIQATDSDSSDADFEQCHTKRPNKLKKNRNVLKVESTDDEMKLSFVPSSDDDFNTPKKGKKKSKPVKMKKTLLTEKKPNNSKVNQCSSSKKEESEIQKNDTELFLCSTCKKDYPSKNKLFQHLRKEGHSIYLPSSTTIHNKSTKKK